METAPTAVARYGIELWEGAARASKPAFTLFAAYCRGISRVLCPTRCLGIGDRLSRRRAAAAAGISLFGHHLLLWVMAHARLPFAFPLTCDDHNSAAEQAWHFFKWNVHSICING